MPSASLQPKSECSGFFFFFYRDHFLSSAPSSQDCVEQFHFCITFLPTELKNVLLMCFVMLVSK